MNVVWNIRPVITVRGTSGKHFQEQRLILSGNVAYDCKLHYVNYSSTVFEEHHNSSVITCTLNDCEHGVSRGCSLSITSTATQPTTWKKSSRDSCGSIMQKFFSQHCLSAISYINHISIWNAKLISPEERQASALVSYLISLRFDSCEKSHPLWNSIFSSS